MIKFKVAPLYRVPLLLILVWAGLLLWPKSRAEIYTDAFFRRLTTWQVGDLEEKYPDNLTAQIDRAAANDPPGAALNRLSQQYASNIFLIAFALRSWPILDNRRSGPLTNPNWPKAPDKYRPSPRADWETYLELARRGSSLEPHNVFFDLMVLHALLAMRRDSEAIQALQIAAGKQSYDSHWREQVSYELELRRLRVGVPYHAGYLEAYANLQLREVTKFDTVGKWLTEMAIAARKRGDPVLALRLSADSLHLAKLLRTKGEDFYTSETGRRMEECAFWPSESVWGARWKMPVKSGAPAHLLRKDPNSLVYYARQNGDYQLARATELEWDSLRFWRRGMLIHEKNRAVPNYVVIPGNSITGATIYFYPRATILRSLPPLFLLWIVVVLLYMRLPSSVPSSRLFWRGLVLGTLFWTVFNAVDLFHGQNTATEMEHGLANPGQWDALWLGALWGQHIIDFAPIWAQYGPAALLLCIVLGLTVRQSSGDNHFCWRLDYKALLKPPEDGFFRFDLSPVFDWVLKVTWRLALWGLFWVLCVGVPFWLYRWSEGAGWAFLVSVAGILCAHSFRWALSPRRVSWKVIFPPLVGMLPGLLTAGTVLYVLLWGLEAGPAAELDRQWNVLLQKGEIAIARQRGKF